MFLGVLELERFHIASPIFHTTSSNSRLWWLAIITENTLVRELCPLQYASVVTYIPRRQR